METNLSSKSKIIPPKPVSEISEIGPSCQDKQGEGLEGNGESAGQHPSSLNPFAPDYVAFSTPKHAQSVIYPLDDSSTRQLLQQTFAKHKEEIAQKQTSGNVLKRLADLMTKRHAMNNCYFPNQRRSVETFFTIPTGRSPLTQ